MSGNKKISLNGSKNANAVYQKFYDQCLDKPLRPNDIKIAFEMLFPRLASINKKNEKLIKILDTQKINIFNRSNLDRSELYSQNQEESKSGLIPPRSNLLGAKVQEVSNEYS